MKKKKLILVGAMSLFIGCSALVTATFVKNHYVELRAVDRTVDFSTANITRRIYFVNNDNWWKDCNMQVHAWHVSTELDVWSTVAVKAYDDYKNGFYYVDLAGAGIGDAIGVQVKLGDEYPDEVKYTVDLQLPSLADKTGDVIYLNSGVTDGKRNASIGCLDSNQLNCNFVKTVLTNICTCATDYAWGYNAYPQLKADVLDPAKEELDVWAAETPFDDFDYDEWKNNPAGAETYTDLVRHEGNYKLSEKIAGLAAMYDEYGWVVAE